MNRLAHRVRVSDTRLRGRLSGTLWVYQCPGCDWWADFPNWRRAQDRAIDHATHCPDLRRLNRPVTLGRPS